MELRMCTNYGWIHKLERFQSIPKHAHIRKHAQRGVTCQARLWNAAIWENTSLSKQSPTRQPLVPRPEPGPELLTSQWKDRERRPKEENEESKWSDGIRLDGIEGMENRKEQEIRREWEKRKIRLELQPTRHHLFHQFSMVASKIQKAFHKFSWSTHSCWGTWLLQCI